MNRGIAIAGWVLVLALSCSTVEAQQMTLTPQLGLASFPQATPDPAFETRVLDQLQTFRKSSEGFTGEAVLLKKDRGPHASRYGVLVTAPSGSGRHLMSDARTFADLNHYQLVGADKLGPLPTVDVLGVHYIKVRPERRDAFEKFAADTLNPAMGNLRPDLRFLYYKAVAGPQVGSYLTVIAITKVSRDKYWPNGSDSDDLKAAFTPAVKALATELQTYLVDGSFGTGMTAAVFESKEWADWVVVPPVVR
jgi:hypothetical protein